jgi:WD40 repeat protein
MSGVSVPQSAWPPDDPFAGHPGPVTAVAVTPDGRQIITGGGNDGTARLWDRSSGQLQTTLTGHTGPVRAVALLHEIPAITRVTDRELHPVRQAVRCARRAPNARRRSTALRSASC